MPHFTFKAKKPSGEIYNSEKDASDRYALYHMIRESGDEVVTVTENGGLGRFKLKLNFDFFLKRIKTIEKINFARNLGSMLEAGLALSRALSVIERQTGNKGLKAVLQDVMSEIDKGSSFADALSKHRSVFAPLFISMVHAGEQSGTLASSLKVTAKQMDSAYSLEKRVKGAFMYPAVIFIIMIIIAVLMFLFVVPTLMKTFTELHVALPLTTRIILGITNIVQHRGLIVLAGFIIIAGIFYFWAKRPTGKKILDSVVLKIPVIGSLVQEVNSARTARTLSSLLVSGVDVVEAVDITSGVIQNVHFRQVLEHASVAIKKGELMSKIFAENTKYYPAFLSEMMGVGEETGTMGDMLLGVATFYENDVEQRTKDVSTIIEPVLMVIIGAAVGFFAISMISPMYSLVNVI